MPADIRAFFEHYREAFDQLDGEAVARLYAVPSGIAADSGSVHWLTFEPIRANMVALCALYRENGYAYATFEPVAVVAQRANYAVADVSWNIERSGQREPWRFNTTYNLMRTAQSWRVLLCTAYSEKKLNARLEP